MATSRAYSAKNKPRAFSGQIKTKYGIDAEDWARMFNAQGGKCAICLFEMSGGKHTHVDHDHETGKIRGLLCTHCNKGLGMFKDSPDIIRRAAKYIEDSK